MEDSERVVKLRRSDSFGYGFSLFGGENCGFPPVVYEVLKNSPADISGVLESGDVIVSVNEQDVLSMTTKEVLKCLRLSNDVVILKIKKDQSIRNLVYDQMAHSNKLCAVKESQIVENSPGSRTFNNVNQNAYSENFDDRPTKNGESITRPDMIQSEETRISRHQQPKFETFMMTGDLIINLNTQSTNSEISSQNKAKLSNIESHKTTSSNVQPAKLDQRLQNKSNKREAGNVQTEIVEKKSNYSYAGNFVRTSKSEDCLQQVAVSTVNIDIEENVATSFSTLLDTSKDNSSTDRIVWTYNAPVASDKSKLPSSQIQSDISCSASSVKNHNSTGSTHHTMNNNLNDNMHRNRSANANHKIHGNDVSTQNAEYEGDDDKCMRLSLAANKGTAEQSQLVTNIMVDENKIYVKVLPENEIVHNSSNRKLKYSDMSNTKSIENYSDKCQNKERRTFANDVTANEDQLNHNSACEEDSDIESLRSFHYSPKAIDMPSALRLAKRLYYLDGFKKSDVSRHLCKNNDFSKVVAEEYLKFFNFNGESLDVAVRKFLKQFCLIGETQERERVLLHFAKRYLDCNPGTFGSHDAVHTLTCALMLLNTDLHGQNVRRQMTCGDFVENLAELNEGENYPKELLKFYYHAIKSTPLEWAVDDDAESVPVGDDSSNVPDQKHRFIGHNPFLDVPNPNSATEYKKGYVMRKCCVDPNGKRTPIGKRSWKMFYATLRDLVLYLHKDEDGFKKNQLYDNLHNSIRVNHALATKATDYTKKCNVFRLQTADQAEYLFQTRYLKDPNQDDSKELQSWIDAINYVAASLSAPPLAAGIGSSQKKFQRPLLPVSQTKLNFREQLSEIENSIMKFEKELEEHLFNRPNRNAKSRYIHEFVETETYLQFELRRYRTYAFLLRSKMAQFPELEPPLVETLIGEVDESSERSDANSQANISHILNCGNMKSSLLDRYSYRAAIYKTTCHEGSV